MTVVEMGRWQQAKSVIGNTRVTLGPQASQQWLEAPEHLAMVLARYRAAAALIGDAQSVLEVGCGEGIGAGILAKGRHRYVGIDTDGAALRIAAAMHCLSADRMGFVESDALYMNTNGSDPLGRIHDAVTALDVIEHVPAARETMLMRSMVDMLMPHGVCVIGTPNAAFDHLASPQSKAGHVNLYTHARLHALMSRYFKVVVMAGMQDTSVHFGHPDARHYILAAGYCPRRGGQS